LDNGDHQERRARFERYLLGTLDEQERASVREAVIRDPDAYAELREMELDLLDAAADGTIEPARKSVVEERLAADTRNHASTLVALALAEHQKREQRKSQQRRPAWRWSVALPAAAGLLMATGLGLFLLRGTFAPGDGTGTSTGAGQGADDPSSTAAATRPPDEALDTAPRVDPRLPAEADAPQGPPSAIAGSATEALPDRKRTVALFLPAGTLRGARPSVRVPPSAETIRLEIELESPAPRFVSITLREVREPSAGATEASSAPPTFTVARVPVRAEGGQSIVSIDVPARVLPTGVIEVHVTARSGTASAPANSTSAPIRVVTFLVSRD
jgi:hypothetical protein